MKQAVHFGAGNIGRGFVGLLLHEAGYGLVFADVAEPLVDAVVSALRERGVEVATGRFGADMALELVGDGPVTVLVDV